jgi:hypothetical protein
MSLPRIRPFRVAPQSPEDRDLFDYRAIGDHIGYVFHSARRHKVVFAACFVIVLGLATALAAVMPLQYEVRASLLAIRNPIMDAMSNPTLNREWDAPARAAREVVTRRDNLVALCRETNFVKRHMAGRSPLGAARDWLRRTLGRPQTEEQMEEGVVDGIENRLWVNVASEGTVTIGMVWSNPQLAFDYVEAALQSFLKARHVAEISTVRETISILETHDARIQKDAIDLAVRLEEKQRALRGSRPVVRRIVPAPAPAPAPALALAPPGPVEVPEDDRRLEATLAMKQRALVDFEEAQRRRLQEFQSRLTEQLNVYAPEHPLVLETRKTIEALRGPSQQLDSLRAEVRELELESRRRGLGRASLAVPVPVPVPVQPTSPGTISIPVPADPNLPLDDPRLEYDQSQLAALLRQHSNLLDRIAAARVEIDTAEAAFKYRYSVLAPPQMPKGPLKPYVAIVLVAGVLGGLLFAFFATTVVDLRSGKVIERWQIERAMGVTILTRTER